MRNPIFLTFLCIVLPICLSGSSPVPNEVVTVEIATSLLPDYHQLPAEEQADQLRDWIVLAAANQLDLNQDELFAALVDFPTVRHDFLSAHYDYRYGPGRSLYLGQGRVAVFYPADPAVGRATLCRELDTYRMTMGEAPREVWRFEYRIDPQQPAAEFIYRDRENGARFFTTDYYYYETVVRSPTDLRTWLQRTDDLVFASYATGRLIVGGRRYPAGKVRGLNFAEIATVFQADQNIEAEYRKKMGDRAFWDAYEQRVEEVASDPDNYLYRLTRGWSYGEFINEIKRELPFATFKERMIQQLIESDFVNIGFSLDPKIDHGRYAANLRSLLNGEEDTWQFYREDREQELTKSISAEDIEDIKLILTFQRNLESRSDIAGKLDFSTLISGAPEGAANDPTGSKTESLTPAQIDAYLAEFAEQIIAKESEQLERALATFATQLHRILADFSREQSTSEPGTESREDFYYTFRRFLEGEESDLQLRPAVDNASYKVTTVQRLLNEVGFPVPVNGTYDAATFAAVKAFQEGAAIEPASGETDQPTLQALLAAAEELPQEIAALESMFQWLNRNFQFQHARYDGDFQGTEVGMNLFYTDLVMKLWSFDYGNTTPSAAVTGFITSGEANIAPIYWAGVWENSSTRSWLGPLEEGYDFFDLNRTLHFQPIATKIFNASSNDLLPGVEVEANAASSRFSSWWNTHYLDVANYEPEYHRLNQIMKWSILIGWLKNAGKDHLNFLARTGVKRNHDFRRWYRDRADSLRVSVEIPFIDPEMVGQRTECLRILQSNTFEAFGVNSAFLSGGVTLGGKRAIRPRLKNGTINTRAKRFRKPGVKADANPASPTEIKLDYFNRREVTINPARREIAIGKTEATGALRGRQAAVKEQAIARKVNARQQEITFTEQYGDVGLGDFRVRSSSTDAVEISSRNNEVRQAQHIVQDFLSAEGGSALRNLQNHPDVRTIIRREATGEYLVQLASENGRWIKLTEQPLSNGTSFFTKVKNRVGFRMGRASNYDRIEVETTFLREGEIRQELAGARWQKIAPGAEPAAVDKAVVELATEVPTGGRTLEMQSASGRSTQVYVTEDGVWLPMTGPADLANSSFLRNRPDLVRQLSKLGVADPSATLVHRQASGELLHFSSRSEDLSNGRWLSLLEETIPAESRIENVILSDGIAGVRYNGGKSIGLARNADAPTLDVVREFTAITRDNPQLLDRLPAGEIRRADLSFLRNVAPDNVDFIRDFQQYRGLSGKLPPGQAFLDLRTAGTSGQVVRVRPAAGVELVTMKNRVDIQRLAGDIQRLVRSPDANPSRQELLDLTRPYVDQIEVIVADAPAKTFITKEYPGFDINTLWQLHGKSAEVRFVRDQASILKSLQNYNRQVNPSLESAVVLVPVDLSRDTTSEFRQLMRDMERSGVLIVDRLTVNKFATALLSPTQEQLFLLTQVDSVGNFRFFDQSLDVASLQELLAAAPDKEMINVISTHTDLVRTTLAESGIFARVVTNEYQLGSAPEVLRLLARWRDYFAQLSATEFQVPENKLAKLLRKAPALGEPVYRRQRSGETVIGVSVDMLSNLPAKVSKKLSAYRQRNSWLESNIDDVLMEQNQAELRRLFIDSPGQYRPIDLLKGSIQLKVQNDLPGPDEEFPGLLSLPAAAGHG